MKYIKTFEDKIEDIEGLNLIKKKLSGEKISEEEWLKIVYYMIDNDKEFAEKVDKRLRKKLKKYVPKGSKIK